MKTTAAPCQRCSFFIRGVLIAGLLAAWLTISPNCFAAQNQSERKEGIEGTWLGALKMGLIELKIVFELEVSVDGRITGSLRSPDQGNVTIPITSVEVEGREIDVLIEPIGGRFKGAINQSGDLIQGSWTQGGATLPLDMKHAPDGWAYDRPQTPVPPFPYRAEEVTFVNPADGTTLAGTLTVPGEVELPVPAVVLVTGSGPQDRDETLMGHKPFTVIADDLSRKGMAVLRYDDRGAGKSSGSFEAATHQEFALDASAAVEYLKTRKEISHTRIGILGHSEGGLVAPLVATTLDDVAFLVLLAAPGVPGSEVLLDQGRRMGTLTGLSEETMDRMEELTGAIYEAITADPDDLDRMRALAENLKNELDGLTAAEKEKLGVWDATSGAQMQVLESPWFRKFVAHDPGPVLEKVKCPVLALNGSLDAQVDAETNLDAIREHLSKGGNIRGTFQALEGLNHLFQKAETGSPQEYSTLTETISPDALRIISEWIAETVSGP